MTFSGIKKFTKTVLTKFSPAKFIDILVRALHRNKVFQYRRPEDISVALCCKVKTDFAWFFEYSDWTEEKQAIVDKFMNGVWSR